ncbi:repressor ROX1 [Favolaschia claudopus]|uniref:Repressor ROX1 n=1 Tax=Favolaschia claudopus TaxID=2862362 RepID=A0AAW0EBL8_9AGAR
MNSHAQIPSHDNIAHLYPFPPTPPSSDSGCNTPSQWEEWVQVSSRPPSPARLARSVRGTERAGHKLKDEIDDDAAVAALSSHYRPESRPPSPPAPLPSRSKARIPRPPNAFILYRSDLLRNCTMPERRQQTLSRVAGECWNLLSLEEKNKWKVLAQQRATEHQLIHPDYHFKPSPRGKGKGKLRPDEVKGGNLIRSLREQYVGITGPSICSSRSKKGRAPGPEASGSTTPARGISQSLPSTPSIAPIDRANGFVNFNWTPLPSSASTTPPPSIKSSPEPALHEPSLPPFFPQQTYPHFPAPRRPSTSLGFIRTMNEEFPSKDSPDRPASAASETGLTDLIRDCNITPTSANFGDIGMPPASEWQPWHIGQPQPLQMQSPLSIAPHEQPTALHPMAFMHSTASGNPPLYMDDSVSNVFSEMHYMQDFGHEHDAHAGFDLQFSTFEWPAPESN